MLIIVLAYNRTEATPNNLDRLSVRRVITEGTVTVLINTESCKIENTSKIWNCFGYIYEHGKSDTIVGWVACIYYKSTNATRHSNNLTHLFLVTLMFVQILFTNNES